MLMCLPKKGPHVMKCDDAYTCPYAGICMCADMYTSVLAFRGVSVNGTIHRGFFFFKAFLGCHDPHDMTPQSRGEA